MFYMYVLKSKKSGSYYIRSCENIPFRLNQHNAYKVRSTKSKAPWGLIYYKSFKTRSEAQVRERQIKSWKKRSAIEKLLKHL
ncbi:MAG: GIY-YIG nuclease family protein [bacterium]